MTARSIRLLLPALLAVAPLGAQQRPLSLDTVRVTAASRASADMATATRAVEVITAEEIRRLPARSVQEVLQWALGVDLMPRSPALADVAIRGSSFEQVLVMVDGARVSDAQTGHFDLNLAVPLDQVERIEILRGPASALYGADAVGGVIHVVTRTGGASSARVEGGSFGTATLAVAHTVPLAAARADLALDLRRSDGHRTGTDYRLGSGRVALAAPLAGRTLRADLAFAARDFGADGFYAPFPSYERTRATTASVAWRAAPAARFSVEPLLSLRRHGDDFVLKRADPAFYRNRHTTQQLGGELLARYAASPRLRFAAGVEGYRDELDSRSLGDRAEHRAAVLAEAAAGQRGRLTGTAGLRADWREGLGGFWSPSLAAAWWPARPLRLRASAGRSLRAPTWTERFYRDPANVGDPELLPERAWSTELGLDAYPAAGVRVGVAAFQCDADQLIDWARAAGQTSSPWRTRNVEDARFRGVEAEIAADELLGLRWWARGSWLSVRSSEAPGFVSKYALRPITESVSLAAEHSPLQGLQLWARAERARRTDEAAFVRVDARASYALRRARLFLDVQNAGDADYPDITGRNAPGRAVSLGVEWRGERS